MTAKKAAGSKPAAKPKAKATAASSAAPRASVSGPKHTHAAGQPAEPLWLDQVEGDGPIRVAFRSCQRAGCSARVELGKVEA